MEPKISRIEKHNILNETDNATQEVDYEDWSSPNAYHR